MQINTLYISTKEITGGLVHTQELAFKVREHIKRFGAAPKKGRFGYYYLVDYNDKELQQSIDAIQNQVKHRLHRIASKNKRLDTAAINSKVIPHYTTEEYKWRSARCSLMCAISNLSRATARKDWRGREDALYYINTHWLTLQRLAYGEHVQYKDHENVAVAGNFIPLKERFFGKRRRAK